ncbi:hypothetical protein COCMIDRAFT_32220 [Bipolaris oryzae ATCC 44560]|uniref:Uncharacterized protein n=1 Tax=Bipolaris oryzae ATCC 44560 TaxID=930090 RepID=W7A304_COCMI|nr:uncharacterized protein COCMIDRAFT_32220 [Bipolaris oryzae ATCC 44560]EUC50391.1 hypothetical protein COCMIDRAFT_32220 [Bipolaris oryzae ATCC 44560]
MKLASPLACVGVFDFTFWFFFFLSIYPAKIRQSLRQTCMQSPCPPRLYVCRPQVSFHQMMRFVHISLSMSVPEVPYARFSIQPSYFLFPLANIATLRRCITAATRLAVACPLAALHR